MLSRAIRRIAQDDSSPQYEELRRNVSSCKSDVLSGMDCGREARRLFQNTTAFDADVIAVKKALAEGKPVVNIVCRGYGNSVQKELTNLIVNTALLDAPTLGPESPDYEEDRRRRMERLNRAIVGRRYFHYPTKPADVAAAQQAIEDRLLGETRFDPDSRYNAVLAYRTRNLDSPLTLPDGDVPMGGERGEELSSEMMMREDDVICDPDVPDSYLYPFLSETGTRIGSYEADAKRKRSAVRNSLLTHPDWMMQTISNEHDRDLLKDAAVQMNRFYHALFNVQGVGVGEGWRFIPYRMSDSSVYTGADLSQWNETENITNASNFVNVSRGLPSLYDTDEFEDVSFDEDDSPGDAGIEQELAVEPPASNGRFKRETTENFITWMRQIAPSIEDDRTDEDADADAILERVYRAAPDVRSEIINRMGDINLVVALAVLTSTATDEWFAAGPSSRAVNREMRSIDRELQQKIEEDSGEDMDEPESEALDAAREQQEEALDPDSIDVRNILAHHQQLVRQLGQDPGSIPLTRNAPMYAVESVDAEGNAHRMIENPSEQALERQNRSLDELVEWWTNPENVPDYIEQNFSPEAVYAWMCVSAPPFGGIRASLQRGGESYIDFPLLERVYSALRDRLHTGASSARGMRKLAAFDPDRLHGFHEFRNRVVGTEGKRVSEIVRGRARSWALSNALRQVVEAFQGAGLEPFEENTASCIPDVDSNNTVSDRTFVVDVSEMLGHEGAPALTGVEYTPGMTWRQLQHAVQGREINLVSEDGGAVENGEIQLFAPIDVSRTTSPIDFSTEPKARITLADPFDESTLGSNFRISFPMAGSTDAPSNRDLMAFEYGYDNVDRVRELQHRYGVSINRGPLPNWAPNPYCFVWDTGEATPNPNNLHNVVAGLRKREKVLAHHRQMEAQGGPESALHKEAVRKLALEVEEMRDLVSWARGNPMASPPRPGAMEDDIIWSPETERETGADPEKQARFNANSLTRYVSAEKDGQPTSPAFYEIVRNRCDSEGIHLPVYDATIDDESISKVVSPDQFRRFLQIKGDVVDDFKGGAKSVLILDHLDNNVSRQHSNGIVEIVKGEPTGGGREGEEEKTTYNLKLMPRAAETIKTFGNAVRDNRQSHVVAITTNPIVTDREDKSVARVVLSIDIASPQVVGEYIRMVEADLQNTLGSDQEAVARAIGFSLPQSFVDKMKKGMSGLPLVSVKSKIVDMVKKLFEQYKEINDIGRVLLNNEEEIREELSALQASSDVRDRLNIERQTPTVGYKEYVTEVGTDWNRFIQGDFAKMAESIRRNRRTIDMLSRCQDFNTFFGAMSHDASEGGVVLHPSYAESGELVWFSPDGSADAKGNLALSAAAERFGVTPLPMRDYLASIDMEGLESVDVDPDSLNTFFNSFGSKLTELEAAIEASKKEINPINVLYGGPGTGKTIFGDVLAKALDLHLDFCTFTQVFHAGGTSLRGQAEANVRDFLNYCRNARDTVMVIDEFDTFFRGSEVDGGAGDMERLRGELQVAWENDKPTYRAHNFYIVCTTNMTLAQMEANQRFQALKSRMSAYEVKLPKSIESMLEFFARGAAVNNLINLTCGDDDRLIEWGKRLVDIWDVEGEERQKNVLINSIQKIDPKFFENTGILRPAMNRAEYLESIGVSHTEPIDPVEDWVMGWKQAQELFNRMERATMVQNTPEGQVEISWLDRIAKLMQEKMIYEPEPGTDPGQNIATRISLRELMAKVQSWISMHGEWERGDKNALPLTYHTMWYGLAGTTFNSSPLTEEQQRLPHYLYLQDDPVLLRGEDGFRNIIDAVNTPNSGLTDEDFMDEASVRYRTEARFIGASKDPLVAFSLDHNIPQIAEKQFDVAKRALRISGTGDDFGSRAEPILQALRQYNSTKYNNAVVMLERFVTGRDAIRENIGRYNEIKEEIMSRPRDQRGATDDERMAIGELLVPVRTMARNGSAPGLSKLLRDSVFAADANLPSIQLESIKNWMSIVIDGYTKIASTSRSCTKISRELGAADLETVIDTRFSSIEKERDEHMRESSLRLSDLAPQDLTPEEIEEFRPVLGLDFTPPAEDFDEIHREIKEDIASEGVFEAEPEAEEPVEEAPAEEVAEPTEEPVEEPPEAVEEPEDAGQTITTAPSPTIHMGPEFVGRPEEEQTEEEPQEQEPQEQEESNSVQDSMVERINQRKNRKSSSRRSMFKTAQVDDQTAERVAGWSNLRYIALMAQKLPNQVETGPFNYIDPSQGLEGTFG